MSSRERSPRKLRDNEKASEDSASHPSTHRHKPRDKDLLARAGNQETQHLLRAQPAQPTSGTPLPDSLRERMEQSFGADFRDVRLHNTNAFGKQGAVAATQGADIHLASERFQPNTPSGQQLIAHELAHVVQQGNAGNDPGLSSRPVGSTGTLEGEARRAAESAVHGSAFKITGAAAPALQYSLLSDLVQNAATKGEAFDYLRDQCPAPGDTDLTAVIQSRFGTQPDDLWLAQTLQQFGPEPLWPPAVIDRRVDLARTHHWDPEPGNIEATLADPDPDRGQRIPPVQAYFFPGRTSRRALIIGGVHGTEPQGVAVVESLRALLAARSADPIRPRPPYFTTILVPNLIARTYNPVPMASTRYVPGLTQTRSGAIERSEIEPNRNFPLAGESYAQARARGAAGPRAPELAYRDPATGVLRTPASRSDRPVDVNSVRMIAETRILLSLIERFQPERLATVHAHSLSHRPGDAPGIFVDPRGVDPYTGVPRTDLLSESQRMADDELTERMVTSGRSRLAATPLPLTTGRRPRAPFDPFMGNVAGGGWTVHYAPSADHPEGTSLGMYAPEPVPGVREGITTITIEVPQYAGSSAGALPAIEDLDRDLLADIFLEDPTTVSTIYPTR